MVLMALAARDDRVVAPVVVRSRPATVRGGPLHPESNGDPVRSTALPLGDGGAQFPTFLYPFSIEPVYAQDILC